VDGTGDADGDADRELTETQTLSWNVNSSNTVNAPTRLKYTVHVVSWFCRL